MKVCSKCKIEKEKVEFYKNKNHKDGLLYWCKTCYKKYHENNKDKISKYTKEYMKEYRKNNKDNLKEYRREYYENNGDKVRRFSGEHSKSSTLYDTYANQISYAEEVRRDPENGELLQVKCTYCNTWFNPTNVKVLNRIAALDGRGYGECRLYCSNECKQLCPVYRRRTKYKFQEVDYSREVQSELRDLVFERDEWTCIKCGETVGLQCHHIEGIQWNPIESADIDICVTFCVKCHEEAHKDKGCRYYDLQCRN